MEIGISYLLLQILLQLLDVAVSGDNYDGLEPRHYNRGERRLGKVVLYRTTSSNPHYTPEAPLPRDRHHYRSYSSAGRGDRTHFHDRRDPGARNIPQEEEYYTSHKSRFNSFSEPNRKYINKRISHSNSENYNTDTSVRRQGYQPERAPNSITDYIQRFNYDHFNNNEAFYNNPHTSFYDRALGSRFRDDLETLVAVGPGGYRHVIGYPAHDNVHSELQVQHKDMTRAHFPRGGSNQDYSDLFGGYHRFFPGSRRPAIQEQHHHQYLYKGLPVFESGNSAEKEYDPRFIALYKTVVEAYRNKHKQQLPDSKRIPLQKLNKHKTNAQTTPQPPGQDFPETEKNIFQKFIDQNRPHAIIPQQQYEQHVPHNGFLFPNFIQQSYRPPSFSHTAQFRPSPPFYRYSEPDPLYHPNRSPFQTYETPPSVTTEPPRPTVPSTVKNSTTHFSDIPFKFPDSINAQLPPPGDDVDTRIPYVAATVVTPQTSVHDQTTPIRFLQKLEEENVATTSTPGSPSTTDLSTILSTETTTIPSQNQWDVLPKLALQKTTLSHEVPPLNGSLMSVSEVKEILLDEGNFMSALSSQSTPVTSGKADPPSEESTTASSVKLFSTPDTMQSLHFLPTVITEQMPRNLLSTDSILYSTHKTLLLLQSSSDGFNRSTNQPFMPTTSSQSDEASTLTNEADILATTTQRPASQDPTSISAVTNSSTTSKMLFTEGTTIIHTVNEVTTPSNTESIHKDHKHEPSSIISNKQLEANIKDSPELSTKVQGTNAFAETGLDIFKRSNTSNTQSISSVYYFYTPDSVSDVSINSPTTTAAIIHHSSTMLETNSDTTPAIMNSNAEVSVDYIIPDKIVDSNTPVFQPGDNTSNSLTDKNNLVEGEIPDAEDNLTSTPSSSNSEDISTTEEDLAEVESSTDNTTQLPNYHHVMSLINQARTHIILSENIADVTDL